MVKIFRFRAKQGQHNQVRDLLYGLGLTPVVTYKGEVVEITAKLPKNLSKRTVDRFLYRHGVPGARRRKNRPIIKISSLWDTWPVREAGLLHRGSKFTASLQHGKRRVLRRLRVDMQPTGCSCCEPLPVLEPTRNWY